MTVFNTAPTRRYSEISNTNKRAALKTKLFVSRFEAALTKLGPFFLLLIQIFLQLLAGFLEKRLETS